MVMYAVKKLNMKTFIPLGLALVGALFFTTSARAECEPFPKVPWWGNLNHEKAASYVSRNHKGNWNPYLEKWAKQVGKLKDVHERQSSVSVNFKGKKVKIAGDALENYIKLVQKRVLVVRCLAQNADYANFSTAAGKKSKSKK